MFQFEKLLKQNNIDENDPELERVIVKKIIAFRKLQQSITPEMTRVEKEDIEEKLDQIDDDIMKTLPDFFDIEDEVEINKQKKAAEKEAQAKKAAEEKMAADKAKKDAAEKAAEEEAKAKKEADEKNAAKQKEDQELNTPATNDDDALDKLFRKGKSKVTESDLKKAGFKTGFFGNLEPSGAVTKNYKLIRTDFSQEFYDLSKK